MDGDDKENGNVAGNKVKVEAVSKRSIDGNIPRKQLADISNLPQTNLDLRLQAISLNTKEYIHKLHQENLALVKVLADRNKTIQLHALELQKLRTVIQELQQKNLQLARTNSQMLAELNSSKDRLKVLQHELGCKNGLLIAKNLESEAETIKRDKIGKSSEVDNKHDEPCDKKRKRQSKSLGSTIVKPIQAKEKINKRNQSAMFKVREQVPADDSFEIGDTVSHLTDKPSKSENKVDDKRGKMTSSSDRHCSRRQSARFKADGKERTNMFDRSDTPDFTTFKSAQAEKNVDDKRITSRRQSARFKCQEQAQEPTGDIFQINDTTVSVPPMHECGPTSSVSLVEHKLETADCTSGSEDQQLRRSSFRPKRQAAEKIQSYKEIPLNAKMRRTE